MDMKGKYVLGDIRYVPGMPYVAYNPWKMFEEVGLGLE